MKIIDDLIVPSLELHKIIPNVDGAGEEDAIHLTRQAIVEIRNIAENSAIIEEYFLRISSQGGGADGFTFKLDFDTELEENDRLFHIEDQKIVVDPKTLFYLMGASIDWVSNEDGSGFIFIFENSLNPTAKDA